MQGEQGWRVNTDREIIIYRGALEQLQIKLHWTLSTLQRSEANNSRNYSEHCL